ncbi:thermonuclease family protein [Caldinitratiruptor microaerophilus]|uniref:TNase-like domain-containing protein n=1 Tax=Caldinitratiruptor microaerophilus TaxID=671077 RepID=A0AA35CQH4_9FIRM|nr:thermonuclease family protein [Caldinitratiruptor microaerophilus]BDG61945.1 hypothetical protein caldi_30350 [Caldinitratiruptor microaerophilus]
MGTLGAALVLLGLIGALTGLVGLAVGGIKGLLADRKGAARFLVGSVVVLSAGGALIDGSLWPAIGICLALLGIIGFIVGLVGLVKGEVPDLIADRKKAAWVLAGSVLMFFLGPSLSPGPSVTGVPTQSQVQAETSVDKPSATQLPPTPPVTQESSPPTHDASQVQSQVEPAEHEPAVSHTQAKVVRAIDGDTIEVEHVSGPKLPSTRVRLIGVDTPESTTQVEPYGKEAAAFTKRELESKTVWLEKDVSETDKYGRALRYVWLREPPAEPTPQDLRSGMFNAILLVRGFAQQATYPPDVKYADLFREFAAEARQAGIGLWAPPPKPAPPEPAPARPQATAPPRGNCDPSYPTVCIPPPPPDLDCKDVPYRRFSVVGADPHRFDGDHDGVGCER